MSRYDGKKLSQEHLMDIAGRAVVAAYKAPQLTGRVEIMTEVVTGDDQLPILEFYREVAPISPVMRFDYETFTELRAQGTPPVFILIGADLTSSELGWNCGACGFKTCGEFNKYAKENRSPGGLWSGPTCNWKLIDFAMACDFVCASIWQSRLDCRAMGTLGSAAANVGYLSGAGCSAVIGVPVGPPKDLVYFSREVNLKSTPYEMQHHNMFRCIPTHWTGFPGNTKPVFKCKDKWWEDSEWIKWEPPSDEEKTFVAETMERLKKISEKYFPEIAGRYQQQATEKERG